MNLRTLSGGIFCLAAILISTACNPDADADGDGDGQFDVAFMTGKADGAFSDCGLQQLLVLLNDPVTSADFLRENGVHSRAAKNLIQHRDGADGVPGTMDDLVFMNIKDVDDVYYVGPVAMKQLSVITETRCPVAEWVSVSFSPQAYENSHITQTIAWIDEAQDTIDLAMYSFRDSKVAEALQAARDRGVHVRAILESARKDRTDPEGTMSARLEEMGIEVRWINKIMHHKFAIIDGPRTSLRSAYTGRLITGSANWSWSAATKYDEATLFLQGEGDLLLDFQSEYNHLWANGRVFEWGVAATDTTTLTIRDEWIQDNGSSSSRFTSANFVIKNTSYGPTFSVVRGSNEITDALVELINQAETSIYIASGHLRLRPVAEAIIAASKQKPGLEIKVYVDDQEYLSEWYHWNQVSDLADCLEEAGDSEAKSEDCVNKGFRFAYQLHMDGIPLRFKYYAYRWHYYYAAQMHHKYMIIDGTTLAMGSFNLSDNAEHNTIENMMFFEATAYPELIDSFTNNFTQIWDTETQSGAYDALMANVATPEDGVPLVFNSMALTWNQVNNLRDAIRSSCPMVDEGVYKSAPEKNKVCFPIQ